uniref:TGF-beta family profile domain-containing protein n=1 Tax=Sinocyclocheilus rhinocerous TaxID=307959 RepID=A0A673I4U0_9TELE
MYVYVSPACRSLEFTLPDLVCTCTTVGCCIIKLFLVLSMQVGVWWWPRSRIRAMPAMPSVTDAPCHRKRCRGRHSSRDCRVEKREMRVRDLGMGFDSDEIVLFKFCVGSCQRSRGNYDLALRALLANGSLPKRTARKVSAHPCCRPTGYEPVSFMDATTTWRTIKSLSAADCECVG